MNANFTTPRKPFHRSSLCSPVSAVKRCLSKVIFALCSLLLLGTIRMSAIEHPGSVHADDNCSSCHADKTKGKSLHSAMSLPCTVCHLARTQGDMTTLNLLMPKAKICFACHEQNLLGREHRPVVNGPCLECHDAHSSNRRMLLREPTNGPRN